MKLILPFPPAILSPNARPHRMALHRAKKKYRHDCWALALASGLRAPVTPKIGLDLEFQPPTAHARDDDNAEAAFKAGRDGLAQALRVDDSRFVTTKRIGEKFPGGRVIVTLSPLTDPG